MISVLTTRNTESLFSLTLHDESSFCSELSWDSEEEESDSFISEDDDYLDYQMMKGDFILEKPLDIHELDRMLGWGVGVKAPPKFKEEPVNDFAVKVPTRRNSITTTNNDTFGIGASFRSASDDDFGIGASLRSAYESVFSVVSEDFADSDIDSLDSVDDSEADDRGEPDTPQISNTKGRLTHKEHAIKQLSALPPLGDEAESIADSAHVSNSVPLEDRWTEGCTHEKSQRSVSRWNEGLTPDKSLRPSIERPMMPPTRRPRSGSVGWDVIKRKSVTSPALNFEIINSQIQAEVGLRLSDSLPAQKIMEAILSVLQNPGSQEDSKEEYN